MVPQMLCEHSAWFQRASFQTKAHTSGLYFSMSP